MVQFHHTVCWREGRRWSGLLLGMLGGLRAKWHFAPCRPSGPTLGASPRWHRFGTWWILHWIFFRATLHGGPKSFRFLPIGLLGIVKMGPRALHRGPTQISSHSTWQSTWRKFGAKALDLSKENGPRFSLAPITKFGPIWDWALKWVKGLYTERPNSRPICKTRVHLLTQIPYQMGFSPNGLGPKYKVPLRWIVYTSHTVRFLMILWFFKYIFSSWKHVANIQKQIKYLGSTILCATNNDVE
jgi:hypothetical protein